MVDVLLKLILWLYLGGWHCSGKADKTPIMFSLGGNSVDPMATHRDRPKPTNTPMNTPWGKFIGES